MLANKHVFFNYGMLETKYIKEWFRTRQAEREKSVHITSEIPEVTD